jgi:glycosyltransferase involved in cell wall biosynthesis
MEKKMKLNAPLVSVMMPTFNVERYVSQAIESVFNQTYSNWELIIVDDGSTDKTPSILAEYAKKDFRVKVYYKSNQGRGKARNSCLEYSQGEYSAVCDSDDISFPERFEKQVKFLEMNPKIGAVGSQLCSFASDPVFDKEKLIYWPTDAYKVSHSLRKGKMRVSNCAAMIRMSLFKEYGNYNEQLNRAQDYEFFRRVALKGVYLTNLTDVLVFYRQNSIPNFSYFIENEIYKYYANYIQGGGDKALDALKKDFTMSLRIESFKLKYLVVKATRRIALCKSQ